MAWRQRTVGPPSWQVRLAWVGLLWTAYLLTVVAAGGRHQAAVLPLGVIPLAVTGALFGWRLGALAGALSFPALTSALAWTGAADATHLLRDNAVRWVVAVIVAGCAGWAAEQVARTREQGAALRREIEGRTQVEAKLRTAASEYRALVENSPDLVSRFGRDRKRLYANRTVERLEGAPRESLVGKGLTAGELPPLPKGTLEAFLEAMDQVFAQGEPVTIEVDGPSTVGPRRFETRLIPEHGPDGQVATVLALSRDVTEHRLATRQLELANQTLAAVIDGSPVAIVQCDHEGVVRLWNPAAERLLGWQADEVIGHPDPSVPAQQRAALTTQQAGLATGTTQLRADQVRLAKDGTQVPVDSYDSRLPTTHQFPGGVVTLLVDLRERQRAREADALRSEQAQHRRFLNTAAHELGTPLTPIRLQIGALRIRLDDRLQEPERRGFDLITRNLERLTRLVQDLLDATRLQAGRLRMERAVVHVDALASDVVRSLEAKAEADGVALVCDAQGGLDVEGDETRLSQVLMNLLQNALKFTPRGGRVTLKAHASPGEDGVDIEVSDTGVGMAPGAAGQVFQPFVRLAEAEDKPGTGLGLFICKGIVEQHGGRVQATSPGLGRGTTFLVHLPRHAPESLTGAAAA